jgi:hypothetical protein
LLCAAASAFRLPRYEARAISEGPADGANVMMLIMLRRLLLTLCLLLALAPAGLCVRSYWTADAVWFSSGRLASVDGGVELLVIVGAAMPLDFEYERVSNPWLRRLYRTVPPQDTCVGFGVSREALNHITYRTTRAPFWFTTTLPALLAHWFRRRGRRRAKGEGFEVKRRRSMSGLKLACACLRHTCPWAAGRI